MKERPLRRGGRGFTLIELLIVMVVMVIVLAAVMQLYVKGQAYFLRQGAAADLQEDVRYPLAWLSRDIQSAVGVATSWGTSTTSASVLILKVPSIDASGAIVDLASDFDYVIYSVADGKLRRTYDGLAGVSVRQDSSRYLGDNVTAFTAEYNDFTGTVLTSGFSSAASVRVEVAGAVAGLGPTLHENYSAKFKLRNRPAESE
ncbi:MAG: prepilin-type N-terminal cleavage/methylation domain-containing protein [Acidobacteriota bacterium]|nr:prepilin-type N-terminal cleavage/methylation domain-containing protein [Acidobacteriota bacterium]